MARAKVSLGPLTDEEEAQIQAGIAKDPDNPELTDEELANLRPAHEVLPSDLHEALKRMRKDRQKVATKELVSLRLDRDVLDHFKASGPGWQTRINEALRAAMAAAAK